MGQYFEDLILQRISRSLYAPEWRHGQPKRLATKEEVDRSPRVIKILRLESYGDSLHNLTTKETLKKEETRAKAYKERIGADAYRLRYLAKLPLEASASLLDLSALEHPFDYTLEVLTDEGPKVQKVDLVETFNFLYGLHVERLEKWENPQDKRVYRVVRANNRENRKVLVLWRNMKDLKPEVERKFLEEKLKAEGPFEEVLVNGDTATPGTRSLDGLFKRLLEEEEA